MGKQPKRNVRMRKKQVIFRLTIGGFGFHRRHGLSKCDEGVQLGRYIYSNFQNSSHP